MEQLTANDWRYSVISGTVCLGAILTACANGPTPHQPASRPASLDRCLVQAAAYRVSGDICEGIGQPGWDAENAKDGWWPVPTASTPWFRPCPDAWQWIGDTTIYLCSDGRVETS
jgi:hypothetical protein